MKNELRIEDIYKKEKHPWGMKPHPLLVRNLNELKKGSILDIGCGDGKDSFYLAENGFNVTALDFSSGALNTLKERLSQADLMNNVALIERDIPDFMKEEKKLWGNIISFVTIHFIRYSEVLKVYEWIKEHTDSGGLNIISDFTNEGSLDTSKGFYLGRGQLLEIYKDWELIEYHEIPGLTKDGGKHMIASIVARKHQ